MLNALPQIALGYEQITDLSSSVGLTVPADAVSALITAEAQDVRYLDSGSDPTADVGMPLVKGVPFTYASALINLRFIEQTSGAILNVLYYK